MKILTAVNRGMLGDVIGTVNMRRHKTNRFPMISFFLPNRSNVSPRNIEQISVVRIEKKRIRDETRPI